MSVPETEPLWSAPGAGQAGCRRAEPNDVTAFSHIATSWHRHDALEPIMRTTTLLAAALALVAMTLGGCSDSGGTRAASPCANTSLEPPCMGPGNVWIGDGSARTTPPPTPNAQQRAAQGIATQPPATTTTPPVTKPSKPLTIALDGIHEAGVDIEAGKYKGQCLPGGYYARLKPEGGSDDIIDNNRLENGGPVTVIIKKGELFEVKRCVFSRA
ncbi:hypothetical protein [Amycolatopsis magusensis]|uniref:Lipoprotein n=1 Tax=Amycolatopsis magusensis TaxID=882444 RepID=A0ABS4Q5S1_9PSEU|nr:hypothetical protein [Amycolatopsis magusensis]MBP2186444.1 hypothetical protein [Amycolatopsis magusensis]